MVYGSAGGPAQRAVITAQRQPRGPRELPLSLGTRPNLRRGAPTKPQKKRRGDREGRGPDPTGTPEAGPDPGRERRRRRGADNPGRCHANTPELRVFC